MYVYMYTFAHVFDLCMYINVYICVCVDTRVWGLGLARPCVDKTTSMCV